MSFIIEFEDIENTASLIDLILEDIENKCL